MKHFTVDIVIGQAHMHLTQPRHVDKREILMKSNLNLTMREFI